jgi:hypothetical protein
MKPRTVIVRCPACGAKTKVASDPERVRIRCPRCKVDVPVTDSLPSASTDNAGSSPAPSTPANGSSSGRTVDKGKTRRSDAGKQPLDEFIYPDHGRPLIKRVVHGALAVIALAAILGVYVLWKDSSNARYQDYLRNVRESIAAHQSCLELLKSGMDLDGNNKRYQDAKAKIEYLLSVRRHLPTPPEPMADTLLGEERSLHDQLAAAERLSLKDLTPPTPAKDSEADSSADVGQSALTPPAKPTPENTIQPRAKVTDPNTVVIALPGVAKGPVANDLLRRFAELTDQQPGQASPVWAGDLLTIHVRPVADPAKFAMKVRFGRILYYSNSDRALTLQLSTDVSDRNERDPMNAILNDLRQREDVKKLTQAMASLSGLKTLDRQAEIAASLEAIAGHADLDQHLRESAVKLLPRWSGTDCVPVLLKLLDEAPTVVKWSALDAIVEMKATQAADAIAK